MFSIRIARLLSLFGLLALILGTSSSFAQAPQPRPKYGPQAIAEAEGKLQQARCALFREDLPPLTPDGPMRKGAVETVAFPVDITDADLIKLMPLILKLPSVTTVSFTDCTRVTDKGIKEILKYDDIKALFLDGCTIDGNTLRMLKPLKQLQWLNLSRTPIRDNDLMTLEDFPMLMHLSIEKNNNLTEEGITNLQKLNRLRSLSVTVENNQFAMIKEVGKLSSLLELKIQPVSDSDTANIAKLSKLQVLDVNADTYVWRARRAMIGRMPAVVKPIQPVAPAVGVRRGFAYHSISPRGFQDILKCTDLHVLRIAGHPINVKGSGLEKLEFLQELDLSGTSIDDESVSYLGKLRGIKKLALSGTTITNAGVRELSACGSLESIALDYLPITDEAVRYLAQNRKLKAMYLNGTRVSCTDKSAWFNFPRLETVELRETNVTDSSIKALANFKTLKLVDLELNCPNVTYDGLQSLRRDLPRTRILGWPCDGTYWVGGGGIPIAKKPDLNYRQPNNTRPPATQTNQPPMAAPPAPPPAVKAPPVGAGTGK